MGRSSNLRQRCSSSVGWVPLGVANAQPLRSVRSCHHPSNHSKLPRSAQSALHSHPRSRTTVAQLHDRVRTQHDSIYSIAYSIRATQPSDSTQVLQAAPRRKLVQSPTTPVGRTAHPREGRHCTPTEHPPCQADHFPEDRSNPSALRSSVSPPARS